jgi:hypothetical protein
MKTLSLAARAVLLSLLAGCVAVPVEAYGPPPPVVVVKPAPRYHYDHGYYGGRGYYRGRGYRDWR